MIRDLAIGHRTVRISKILCVARNYADHAKEMGTPVPNQPIFFLKPTTALLLGGGTILIPPESMRVEVETELAVILNEGGRELGLDRKSTRLNSSHVAISYAVFCLKKKTNTQYLPTPGSLTTSGLAGRHGHMC